MSDARASVCRQEHSGGRLSLTLACPGCPSFSLTPPHHLPPHLPPIPSCPSFALLFSVCFPAQPPDSSVFLLPSPFLSPSLPVSVPFFQSLPCDGPVKLLPRKQKPGRSASAFRMFLR